MNTLCALAAESPRDGRARGLAVQLLGAMRTISERQGLTHLVAPVRPSLKERYPMTPIERYVDWRRDDGQLFDPWMRVHERLGARLAGTLPESLRITGTVAEWESWTGMEFPESGDYVVPGGAGAGAHRPGRRTVGSYWEPNVWMVHPDLVSLDRSSGAGAGARAAVGDAVRRPGGVAEHRPAAALGVEDGAEPHVAPYLRGPVVGGQVEVPADPAVRLVEPLQQELERLSLGPDQPAELRRGDVDVLAGR